MPVLIISRCPQLADRGCLSANRERLLLAENRLIVYYIKQRALELRKSIIMDKIDCLANIIVNK